MFHIATMNFPASRKKSYQRTARGFIDMFKEPLHGRGERVKPLASWGRHCKGIATKPAARHQDLLEQERPFRALARAIARAQQP
jgi:hypothetical protein